MSQHYCDGREVQCLYFETNCCATSIRRKRNLSVKFTRATTLLVTAGRLKKSQAKDTLGHPTRPHSPSLPVTQRHTAPVGKHLSLDRKRQDCDGCIVARHNHTIIRRPDYFGSRFLPETPSLVPRRRTFYFASGERLRISRTIGSISSSKMESGKAYVTDRGGGRGG